MTIYYAKSTNGFYDTVVNIKIPTDAVEITEEEHQLLLNNQANGFEISSDANGKPINIPVPPPSPEQIAAEQAFENAKASALAKLTALGLTQAEVTALLG